MLREDRRMDRDQAAVVALLRTDEICFADGSGKPELS